MEFQFQHKMTPGEEVDLVSKALKCMDSKTVGKPELDSLKKTRTWDSGSMFEFGTDFVYCELWWVYFLKGRVS